MIIIYGIVIALLIIVIGLKLIKHLDRNKKVNKENKVYFVGKRSTGKTRAIIDIIEKQRHSDLAIKPRETVPTTKDTEYKSQDIKINNLKLCEYTPNINEPDTLNRFRINTRDTFIFFLRDQNEFYPMLAGFDIKYVYWKKTENKERDDVTYLDEDSTKLLEMIYKIRK
ncbi:hypothetical protein A0H76_872 [Hepatospora eriocheir]|uniref:Uncharacterized protein n=1 Tax=Hepatospora eriocheir TaxID=1081669 RepID=A0A1X0QLH5_9MICR|nr:hypothetical protein HERIO_280 [Hepatospora eriocheir]ORE00642.1 hypothetical protein A0H76_872 [Hepatospora eriocheir]